MSVVMVHKFVVWAQPLLACDELSTGWSPHPHTHQHSEVLFYRKDSSEHSTLFTQER
jgi:hypothetical protein